MQHASGQRSEQAHCPDRAEPAPGWVRGARMNQSNTKPQSQIGQICMTGSHGSCGLPALRSTCSLMRRSTCVHPVEDKPEPTKSSVACCELAAAVDAHPNTRAPAPQHRLSDRQDFRFPDPQSGKFLGRRETERDGRSADCRHRHSPVRSPRHLLHPGHPLRPLPSVPSLNIQEPLRCGVHELLLITN